MTNWASGAGIMRLRDSHISDACLGGSPGCTTSITMQIGFPGTEEISGTIVDYPSNTPPTYSVTYTPGAYNTFYPNAISPAVIAAAITGGSNASAAVLTVASAPATGATVYIKGFNGNWLPANGIFVATNLSATTFSIPIDSTAFSTLTGTPTFVTFSANTWYNGTTGSSFMWGGLPFIAGYAVVTADCGIDVNHVGPVYVANSNVTTWGQTISAAGADGLILANCTSTTGLTVMGK